MILIMSNKHNSLSHTKWLCKYHIVFTPKYRRKIEYNQYKRDIVNIIQRLCKYKGVEIIEGYIMPDHIHLLLSIPPKYSVSSIMGYLKGKSSLMIFDMHSNLKYKYRNRKFWAEGYYVSAVGLNESIFWIIIFFITWLRCKFVENISNESVDVKNRSNEKDEWCLK